MVYLHFSGIVTETMTYVSTWWIGGFGGLEGEAQSGWPDRY